MRFCVVGIGGCGGHLAEKFLRNQDITIRKKSLGEPQTFGGVKGLWLEADVEETEGQSFFGPLDRGCYPGFFIPHDVIRSESKTSKKIQKKYGYDIKKQGFARQAEFLKAVFEIFDKDEEIKRMASENNGGSENPILKAAWGSIRSYTTLAKKEDSKLEQCDGILFVVSLGGGTGTGFVNPITKYIKVERSAYPVFVLAVLTQKGFDPQQRAKEPKRDLAAVISLYDLITKERNVGVDGVILVDNEILIEKYGQDFATIDEHIYQAMKPLVAGRHYPGENPPSLAMSEKFLEGLDRPSILVPCYHREKRHKDPEENLVEKALSQGQLFGCNPNKADRAYVFTRGFMKFEKIVDAVDTQTGLPRDRIEPWRKLGEDNRDEILILLRNPYGGDGDAFQREGTLEYRIHGAIEMAIKYMDDPENKLVASTSNLTKKALKLYFYGEQGLA
ncbi:MAG: hypothetical protein ACXQT4_03260, partial [Methanotrichaceae archaeon]